MGTNLFVSVALVALTWSLLLLAMKGRIPPEDFKELIRTILLSERAIPENVQVTGLDLSIVEGYPDLFGG